MKGAVFLENMDKKSHGHSGWICFGQGGWKKSKNISLPKMVVSLINGDESHGIESVKNHLKNKQKPKMRVEYFMPLSYDALWG